MAKTHGSTSFIYVRVSDICRFLQQDAAVKVSRKQFEALNLVDKIIPLDPEQIETKKIEHKTKANIKVTDFEEEKSAESIPEDKTLVAMGVDKDEI